MIYFHPGEIDFRNGNNGKKKSWGKIIKHKYGSEGIP